MKNIKTIVFDLYNTLIEIKEPKHFFLKLYKESKNGFDIDLSSYTKLLMTSNMKELVHVLPDDFIELFEEDKEKLKEELNTVIVYEEVHSVLNDLKDNFNLFLISNLAPPYKKPFFDNNLDQYFKKMIFSCDYGALKPERKIFDEVERLTENLPNEILMVGDSLKSDVIGAKNNGWFFLRIKRKGLLKEKYDILDLREIEKRISK